MDSAMTAAERDDLASLSDVIPIFRGYGEERKLGLSWTDQKDIAFWMASRYDGEDPRVVSATCRKAAVLAYFLHRNEHEVVVDPGDVAETGAEVLPPEK
jgi:hypothetical protein